MNRDNRARERRRPAPRPDAGRVIKRARQSRLLDRDALRVDERDARRAQHVGNRRVVAGKLVGMCETNRIIINDEGPAQP